MNRKKLVVLSCIFILFLSTSVFAAEGPYISGNIGMSWLMDSDTGNAAEEVEFDTSFVLGAAIGYDFGYGRSEVEVGYRSHNIDDWSGEGDVTALNFLLNGYYDFHNDTAFTPYVGFGLGFAYMDLHDVEIGGVSYGDDDDIEFAYQLGGGVGYAISETLTAEIGYRYFATTDVEIHSTDVVEYDSHNISLAIRKSF